MPLRDQSKWLRVTLRNVLVGLVMPAAVLLALAWAHETASQTATGGAKGAKSKSAPRPQATPSPSKRDELGNPPPIPLLRKKEEEINPGEIISVTTTEVMLPVTVRDAGGRLVSDLTRRDFRVFEDDREQPLSDLAIRKVPVDVILMVDSSSSVAANLADFRRAAERFAEQLDPSDRFCLIKFDDRVELLQDWTGSRFQLRRALNRIEAGIFTRFNDALFVAAREQFVPRQTRRAIVVLSDGIDSGRGALSTERALQALLAAQATVYVISNTEISRAAKKAELDTLTSGSDSAVRFNELRIEDLREGLRVLDESERKLAHLASATGGRIYKPLSFDTLDDAYKEIAEELRQQYAIYYSPLNRAHDGSFRRVRVELNNQGLKATTRIGYYAPRG